MLTPTKSTKISFHFHQAKIQKKPQAPELFLTFSQYGFPLERTGRYSTVWCSQELLKQDNTVDQYRDPQNQNLDDPSNFQIHADVLMVWFITHIRLISTEWLKYSQELPEQDDAAWGGLQSELPSAPTNSRTLADLCPVWFATWTNQHSKTEIFTGVTRTI